MLVYAHRLDKRSLEDNMRRLVVASRLWTTANGFRANAERHRLRYDVASEVYDGPRRTSLFSTYLCPSRTPQSFALSIYLCPLRNPQSLVLFIYFQLFWTSENFTVLVYIIPTPSPERFASLTFPPVASNLISTLLLVGTACETTSPTMPSTASIGFPVSFV
jgi:hypothetical protein